MLAQVLTGSALVPLPASRQGLGEAASERPAGALGHLRACLERWPAGLIVPLPLLLAPAAGSPSDLGRIGLLVLAVMLLAQAGAVLGRACRCRSAGRLIEAIAAAALLGAAGCLLAGMLDPALRVMALSLLAVEIALGLGHGRCLPLVVALAGTAAALRLEAATLLLDLRHGLGLALVGFLLGTLVALACARRERQLRALAAAPGAGPAGGMLLELGLGAAAAALIGIYLALLAATPALAADAGPLAYLSVPLVMAALLRWWQLAVGPGAGCAPTRWLRDPALAVLLGGWGISLALMLHVLPATDRASGMLHLMAPIW